MDFSTLTADQLATLDADDFAALPLDYVNSSSSASSLSSFSSASSGSTDSSSSLSSVSSASSHSSASSASTESSSSFSSPSSVSSSSSSSSSEVKANKFHLTIDGDHYLTIAEQYAEAYESQQDLANLFYLPVQTIQCQDDVDVTADLIEPFFNTYLMAVNRYNDFSSFLPAVKTIQRNVESGSGLSAAEWIAEVVPGGVVPAGWAALSKLAGYDIDSVIDPLTVLSSSSS